MGQKCSSVAELIIVTIGLSYVSLRMLTSSHREVTILVAAMKECFGSHASGFQTYTSNEAKAN